MIARHTTLWRQRPLSRRDEQPARPRGTWFPRFCLAAVLTPSIASAADWPMWRHNSGRTAVSSQKLPDRLHLQWVRRYPPRRPAFWQVRQDRLQFDLGYEPIVVGKTILFDSSRNDRVTALDTETGEQKWRFHADGPVRLAPAASRDRIYFGSEDGHMYCLNRADGALIWKFRAVPSGRKASGNGRLISVWPVRGGPLVANGRVYFAAGVWLFLYEWIAERMTAELRSASNDEIPRMTAELRSAVILGISSFVILRWSEWARGARPPQGCALVTKQPHPPPSGVSPAVLASRQVNDYS